MFEFPFSAYINKSRENRSINPATFVYSIIFLKDKIFFFKFSIRCDIIKYGAAILCESEANYAYPYNKVKSSRSVLLLYIFL